MAIVNPAHNFVWQKIPPCLSSETKEDKIGKALRSCAVLMPTFMSKLL